MKNRVCVAVVVIGLLATVAGVSGGVAGASGTDAVARRYVALGDSVTFGYSELLEDPWIPERFVGYPEIIQQRTGLTTTNLGCPGQTAQALISRTAIDNGCFDQRAYARKAGFDFLHTDYRGTQLDAALAIVRSKAPLSLISMQGGGNDWYICAFDSPSPKQCLDDFLPRVTDSLRQAVNQLRAAGYRGPIVIVGYHLVMGFEAQLRRVNTAIQRATGQPGVTYADVATPFDRYAREHHGDLCTAGLLVAFPDGSCDPLHPSRTGHGLVADAVLAAAA
jgi:lysophospholipase L1-like esterase